jgi:phosphohistidine phosphatase
MKTIILVRHAKSSWKDPRLEDFERPLNKRGKRDAPLMGEKLKERQILPDQILSSPAKRARKTADLIAEAIGYPRKNIQLVDKMYHCGASDLLALLKKLDDKHTSVMLFGHNPEFVDFAGMMLKPGPVQAIPTTGVYCIRFPVDSWKKVQKGKGESVFFDYPKRYQDESAP